MEPNSPTEPSARESEQCKVFMCFPTFPVEQGWNESWEGQSVVCAAEDISAKSSWLSCGQGGRDAQSAWTPWINAVGGKDGLWAGQIIQMEFTTHLRSFHKYLLEAPACALLTNLYLWHWVQKLGWGCWEFSHVLFYECVSLFCCGNIFITSIFHLKISLWFTYLLPLSHSCPHWCWNKWTRRHASCHVKWLLLCPVQILAETVVGAWPVVLHKDVQVPTILLL